HSELVLDEQERLRRASSAQVEAKAAEVRAKLEANPQWTNLQQLAGSGFIELQRMAQAAESASETRHHLADALRKSLANNEFHLVDWAVKDAALRHGWRVEEGDLAYRKLGRQLLRTWLGVLSSASARDNGDYSGDSDVVVPIAKARKAGPDTAKSDSIRRYFEAYLAERHTNLGQSGLKDRRATIRQFAQVAGEKPVSEYRKADLMAYKKLLTQLPARVEKLYPGLPLSKAVELNRRDGNPTLKTASIRNKLSTMSAFGEWIAENVDGVDAGNFKVSLPRKTDAGRMEPFSEQQVAAILGAKAFTGCESEKNQQAPG